MGWIGKNLRAKDLIGNNGSKRIGLRRIGLGRMKRYGNGLPWKVRIVLESKEPDFK